MDLAIVQQTLATNYCTNSGWHTISLYHFCIRNWLVVHDHRVRVHFDEPDVVAPVKKNLACTSHQGYAELLPHPRDLDASSSFQHFRAGSTSCQRQKNLRLVDRYEFCARKYRCL